ncbi:MAG TPA: hypoxanthine phosphoribosyltransferase [Planctomycetota bacterium]|nr:hypoxanthine phosphoribosyltransferase [Planctomycetota bacterium]
MITAEEIAKRVKELGAQISADYKGEEVVLVGVLKGCILFMADLAREIHVPLTLDFLRVSSYEGTKSSGVVRFDFDLTQPIQGKHVLVCEDIIDTGLTMTFLLETLHLRHPKSVKLVSLLDKPANRRAPVEIHYRGFEIPNRFVIGYGLDLDGQYRNLPFIGAKRGS